MQQTLSESFEQFSRRQHRDMESRQRLTVLLEQQIDQNEQLRLENAQLVKNQRKLLELLQLRDQMLARASLVKRPNDSRHDDTMEHTGVLNDTTRHIQSPKKPSEQQGQLMAQLESLRTSSEATRAANVSLEHRMASLNALLLQKDQEVEKARLYNAQVYQKMEEQHEQDERELLRLREKLYTATLELESRRKELIEEQRNSAVAKEQQGRLQQEKELRLREELEHIKSAKERAVRERDQALSLNNSLAASHQQTVDELTESLGDYKRQVDELEQHLSSNLQELKEKYQQLSRQEEEIKSLRQQNSRKAEECEHAQASLRELQEQLQNESMRDGQAVAELQEVVGRLKKEMDLQIRNNNNLRKEIIDLERQAKLRQETELTEDSKLQEMQLTIEQLKSRNDREKEETERTIERLQRDLQRKEKQLLQCKKAIKELESELDNKQQTLEDMEEELKKRHETASTKEKKLKEQLQKSLEETDKSRNESRLLKRELENMEGRVRSVVGGMDERAAALNSELQQCKDQLKSQINDSDHLKRLYEKSELELSDSRQLLDAKQREVQLLRRRAGQLEKQLESTSDQLKDALNDQSKQEQVAQLKKEINEWKLRLNSVTEANSKMKGHNTELVKETISLNEVKKSLSDDVEKLRSELKQSRQDKSLLEQTLEQKNNQLEKSSPYITRLVEEKKLLELEKTKMISEIKSYQHLLEVAKKTKADEIVNLNREVAALRKKLEEVPAAINQELTQLKKLQSKYEQEIRQANKTIENNNREKVNMLRENTVREDHYIKLEKDNKQLREDKRMLEDELKRMQALFDEYQKHLQVAERIANQISDDNEQYEPPIRHSRLTADPLGPSKTLDVSPIRSSSHSKTHVSSAEGQRPVGHSLPGSTTMQRHEVQQRIRGYQKDILGKD